MLGYFFTLQGTLNFLNVLNIRVGLLGKNIWFAAEWARFVSYEKYDIQKPH
jgi:hypothetical protein